MNDQALKARSEYISSVFLLFPTICHIVDTPNGHNLAVRVEFPETVYPEYAKNPPSYAISWEVLLLLSFSKRLLTSLSVFFECTHCDIHLQ